MTEPQVFATFVYGSIFLLCMAGLIEVGGWPLALAVGVIVAVGLLLVAGVLLAVGGPS